MLPTWAWHATSRPAPPAFCLSVGGSPVSTDGLDVQMTDLGDRYFVKAVTETGKALMKAAGSLLSEPAATGPETGQAGAYRRSGLSATQD